MTDTEVLAGKNIALVSTVPYFMVTQLAAQIEYLRSLGFQITLITSPGKELDVVLVGDGLAVVTMDIARSLHIWRDLKVLFQLMVLFHKKKFDIVHSTTPKAGLLCSIAGLITRIPIRLHTFTGQPWVSLTGPMAWIARHADSVIGKLNTHCYADSESQRDFLISHLVIDKGQISVVGAGSIAGVNLARFDEARFSQKERQSLHTELGFSDVSKVILFVGRITRDKGIFELLEAFHRTLNAGINVELLLVGPLDQDCGGEESVSIADISGHSRIHHVGFTDCPEKYMAIADLLCVPSYREGFGTVIIEAAAMGVPTLGTKIYGLTDSVEDGVTGVLVPVRDTDELSEEMMKLLNTPDRLHDMGIAAQARCQSKFDAKIINKQLVQEYERLLKLL